ncbi:MAG: GTPase [Clostridia bacterium]|nr:GTPase [Clostridia bacterium]
MAQQQKRIPVYLFTGFLEGGKTHIIQESMADSRFNAGEKTLIIQCEEGEDELDPTTFASSNVCLEIIEDIEQLTEEYLTSLQKKHKMNRVIIEYNGMWMLDDLYRVMPENWGVFQEMMFADAATFLTYNANMRQLMVDKLTGAEMVVLNRTPADIDKETIHKVIRATNRRCNITYDYPDGHVEYDEIEDPLPYDMEADVVEIDPKDYAVFYRDLAENMTEYDGKTLRFLGIVGRDRSLNKSTIVIGRHVMTCCADDIAFNGLVCIFPEEVPFKTREWLTVTARVSIESHKLYSKKGPVLHATAWEKGQCPDPEVATFY